MKFELLVATRYLRAKRKQAVISTITLIAILGVGAGVAALVVAMAVSEGQREDIRDRLLGAQSHLTIIGGPAGIPNYEELTQQIESVEGVVGVPGGLGGVAGGLRLIPWMYGLTAAFQCLSRPNLAAACA